MTVIEAYVERQYRSGYANFVGPVNDDAFSSPKWVEGVSLDGFPVPENYEVSYTFMGSFEDPEEDEYLIIETRRSMSRSRWEMAWEDDGYEADLALKLRKPHPARPCKSRK